VFRDDGEGASAALNVHGASGVPDLEASLDDLTASAPNLASVALVVGWFGDDLRAGKIAIRPCVEAATTGTYPESWSVNGVTRRRAGGQPGGRQACLWRHAIALELVGAQRRQARKGALARQRAARRMNGECHENNPNCHGPRMRAAQLTRSLTSPVSQDSTGWPARGGP
jgi:hypothetical protein